MSVENDPVPPLELNPTIPPPASSGGIPTDPKQIVAKLDLPGKLLGGGAVLGLIAVFLPAMTINVFGNTRSFMVLDDWRGKLGMVSFAAILYFVYLMYFSGKTVSRNQLLGCIGAAGAAILFSAWLFFNISGNSGSLGMGGASASTGFGLYVSVLAAGAAGYGGFLKAKEARIV